MLEFKPPWEQDLWLSCSLPYASTWHWERVLNMSLLNERREWRGYRQFPINVPVVGSIMAHQRCPCPNPQTCEYIMLHDKGTLEMWLKLGTLRGGGYPGHPDGPDLIMRVPKSGWGRQKGRSDSCRARTVQLPLKMEGGGYGPRKVVPLKSGDDPQLTDTVKCILWVLV